jgi:gluconate 5-dehydrogenase
VNAIGPGHFETELTATLVANQKFSSRLRAARRRAAEARSRTWLGTLILLSCDASASVNAQVAHVDGGVLAVLQTGPARPGYAPEGDVQHTMSASEIQH